MLYRAEFDGSECHSRAHATFDIAASRAHKKGGNRAQLSGTGAAHSRWRAHVLAAAKAGDLTLAALIRWYIDTFESISPCQRSKQSVLEFLEGHPIGQIDPLTLTADVLIGHVRQRRLSGLCPSTVWNDLCWIRVVLDAAKTAKNSLFH